MSTPTPPPVGGSRSPDPAVTTPAGWYPAPHANGEMTYWDGNRWLDPLPAPIPLSAKPPRGLALAALIVGIVAFLTGILPVVGAAIGVAALALGITAVVKGQPRGLAIASLILGAVAVITSVAMTIGIANLPSSAPKPLTSPSSTADDQQSTSEPSAEEPSAEPSAAPTAEAPPAPTTHDLSTFVALDERAYALIVKDPDAHVGENLILYGSIMQFDSATGRCAMIISTAATQQEMSFDYDQNVMAISGDAESTCPVFDPLVEDDHVKIWATVVQSFSYDTQIGGNTTVPLVEVWSAELLPATEY